MTTTSGRQHSDPAASASAASDPAPAPTDLAHPKAAARPAPLPTAGELGWSVELPALDPERSPVTGLTRDHWAAAADGLLLALRPYASPAGGRIDLPGRPSRAGWVSDGLEGWARTFALAALRVAGENGDDPHGHLAFYRRGLVAGTAHAGRDGSWREGESWQPIRSIGAHGSGQPMVESADVALGLHLTRPWLWDGLDPREQDAVEAWLRDALRYDPAANNWYLFPMMVAGFLESVGRGDGETRASLDHAEALLEQWYVGDGWYSDGDGRAFDHYIGWIMHLYPVLLARLTGDEDRLERYGVRLREFLGSFAATFDADGAPLYQGRSLTYRTAALSAPAIGAVTGHTPLSPGRGRGLCSATLRYFLDRGGVEGGLFTLGWHRRHEASLQVYSGPGSPYWASHGFAALLLPADDPFWTAEEEAAPAVDSSADIASVGWLIQRSSDGLVRVHNHGSDHVMPAGGEAGFADPLYARVAYSTRTGPTHEQNVSDNDVQIEHDGRSSARHRIHPLGSGPNWAASTSRPVFPGTPGFADGARRGPGPAVPQAWIDVAVLVDGELEIRVAKLRGVRHGHPVRFSGWAIADGHPDRLTALGDSDDAVTGVVDGTGLRSELAGLAGLGAARLQRAPAGTAYGDWALVPTVTGRWEGRLLIAAARLSSAAPGSPVTEDVVVEVDDVTARIRTRSSGWSLQWNDLAPTVRDL